MNVARRDSHTLVYLGNKEQRQSGLAMTEWSPSSGAAIVGDNSLIVFGRSDATCSWRFLVGKYGFPRIPRAKYVHCKRWVPTEPS